MKKSISKEDQKSRFETDYHGIYLICSTCGTRVGAYVCDETWQGPVWPDMPNICPKCKNTIEYSEL